jgi:hypothetical protein
VSAAIPSESTDPGNAAFFGLAVTAALNTKLLGADLQETAAPGTRSSGG